MCPYFPGFALIVLALTLAVAVPPVSSVAVSVTWPLPFFCAFFVAGAMIRPGLLAASLVVVAAAAPPVFTVQLASQVALMANFFFTLSPASEPVMAMQGYLLDDALDDLEDERSGVTDLYFVGFAPDSRNDGFRKELDLAQDVMDDRFDTRGRSIALINHRDTLTQKPFATLTNLRRVLNGPVEQS